MIVGVLGVTLAGAPARATPPTAPDEPAPESVTLEFDGSLLDDDQSERLRSLLPERIDPILDRAGLVLLDGEAVSKRTLRVRVIAFDPERRDYEVELEMLGDLTESKLPPIVCDACSEARLLAVIAGHTARVVGIYEEFEELFEWEDESMGPSEPVEEELDDEPRIRLIGVLGYSGIGVIGLGIAACATGGYLFNRGVEEYGDPGGANIYFRDYRTPGWITLGAGGLTAAIGVTLLIVDVKRRLRDRNISAQLTPTYLGLQFQQRF